MVTMTEYGGMWVGNDTKPRRFTSEWDGRTKQEKYFHEMVALFDAHFFWTLCECHMFEFDLCECEHKRQHQIYFTSGATTMRSV